MKAHADTVGTDTEELLFFSDETTNKQLDAYAQEFGQNHWDSYDYSETEEESEEYYQACDAWWEEYNEDEHGDLEGRDT